MIELSQSAAIVLILINTFLWGSWYQFVKRLGDYPLYAFMLWLYTFACIIVWAAIFILAPWALPDGIMASLAGHTDLVIISLVCGVMFSAGNQINMMVVKKVGLILSTSVSASLGVLVGTLISCLVGGVPEGISVPLLVVATLALLAAILICQKAGRMRDQDQGRTADQANYKKDLASRWKYLAVMAVSMLVLTPTYTFNLAYSAKTPLRPDGIPSILCIGLMAIGSFVGSLVISGIRLTKNKTWGVLCAPRYKKYIAMAAASGFCHYGGNLLYSIAAPVLSHAIAWPMGTSFNVWSYIWGLGYGEFRGTRKRTLVTLCLGVVLFVVGVLLLASNLYW